MRCLIPMSMLLCAALSLSNCTPSEIDSFCQLYRQVIVEKGDGSIKAPPAVKRRLLANELLYRQQCKGN